MARSRLTSAAGKPTSGARAGARARTQTAGIPQPFARQPDFVRRALASARTTIIQIGHATVSVVQGDITTLAVDAIVNAANNHFWMGGGVAGAIKRAGGIEIERDAMAQGPVEVGEAVVTGAGRLPCRHVIHAATMGQDLQTSAAAIRRATRNSLLRANDLKIGSVAFPALGTGVGGFPVSQAAQIMVEEVVAHLRSPTSLHGVIFAVMSSEVGRTFQETLSAISQA